MVLWTCSKCKRSFQKTNQLHSCKQHLLSRHFEGKDYARKLYNELLVKLKTLGEIKVESLPCCIHLVKPENAYNFAAVYALKEGLRFHICLDGKIEDKRIRKSAQLSKTKNSYELDTKTIDKELIGLLKKAYAQK